MYYRDNKVYGVICPKCGKESFYPEQVVFEGISLPLYDNLQDIEEDEEETLVLPYSWRCAQKDCEFKQDVNLVLGDTVPNYLMSIDDKVKSISDLQESTNETIKILFNRFGYLKLFNIDDTIDESKFTTVIKDKKIFSATKIFGRFYIVHDVTKDFNKGGSYEQR